jgi:hypothetical protein
MKWGWIEKGCEVGRKEKTMAEMLMHRMPFAAEIVATRIAPLRFGDPGCRATTSWTSAAPAAGSLQQDLQ